MRSPTVVIPSTAARESHSDMDTDSNGGNGLQRKLQDYIDVVPHRSPVALMRTVRGSRGSVCVR